MELRLAAVQANRDARRGVADLWLPGLFDTHGDFEVGPDNAVTRPFRDGEAPVAIVAGSAQEDM